MNPKTNRFEELSPARSIDDSNKFQGLLRPDGTPVPDHWSIFVIGQKYVINNYTFRCSYIGETSILFEPIGPIILSKEDKDES